MLDIDVRDGAARTGRLSRGERSVPLPLLLHVHTPARPAPEFAAAVVSRDVHPSHPTFLHTGTWFSPEAAPGGDAFVGLPRALVYPPAAGPPLLATATTLNETRGRSATVAVMLDPAAAPASAELAVLAGCRTRFADPWTFPAFLVAARERAGSGSVLYAAGMGLPDEMALLAYAGVDVFDTAAAHLATADGLFATTEGLVPAERFPEPPCACPGCLAGGLRLHNLWACELERRRVAAAIRAGRLRELVEVRVRASPGLVSMLRRFDRDHAAFFEARAPITRAGELRATSHESITRPEVARWVPRLEERYVPPPSVRVLVVVPCAATKPYSDSPTHQRIDGVLRRVGKGRAHKVTLTSPLGAVPDELELSYPAGSYDIPVTGTWFGDEEALIRRAFGHLRGTKQYHTTILHVGPDEAEILRDVVPDAVVTGGARPVSPDSLGALGQAVAKATAPDDGVPGALRFQQAMLGRATWQFGHTAASALLEAVHIKGRYPYLKVLDEERRQLAMFLPERGLLSLTIHGARRIAPTGAYGVEIEDFTPRGSVFAVGVEKAGPEIRVGDDVVVTHRGDVRAVGKALMCGAEMDEASRGVAVEVRHHA